MAEKMLCPCQATQLRLLVMLVKDFALNYDKLKKENAYITRYLAKRVKKNNRNWKEREI